jgi:hypothetical protein
MSAKELTVSHNFSFHLVITVSITFVNPSISSSTVRPEKFMLQPTYTGSAVFRASILATRLA